MRMPRHNFATSRFYLPHANTPPVITRTFALALTNPPTYRACTPGAMRVASATHAGSDPSDARRGELTRRLPQRPLLSRQPNARLVTRRARCQRLCCRHADPAPELSALSPQPSALSPRPSALGPQPSVDCLRATLPLRMPACTLRAPGLHTGRRVAALTLARQRVRWP